MLAIKIKPLQVTQIILNIYKQPNNLLTRIIHCNYFRNQEELHLIKSSVQK